MLHNQNYIEYVPIFGVLLLCSFCMIIRHRKNDVVFQMYIKSEKLWVKNQDSASFWCGFFQWVSKRKNRDFDHKDFFVILVRALERKARTKNFSSILYVFLSIDFFFTDGQIHFLFLFLFLSLTLSFPLLSTNNKYIYKYTLKFTEIHAKLK